MQQEEKKQNERKSSIKNLIMCMFVLKTKIRKEDTTEKYKEKQHFYQGNIHKRRRKKSFHSKEKP